MTINYTTSLALGQPVTGTESGTWGDDVNNAITSYLDIAVAGTLTISTDADVTLSQTQGTSSATNISSTTAQYMQLLCSGARTALRNISVPNVSKMYVVNNATTGGFGVKIRGVTGPTTGITVANGEKALVMWNGSDFVKIASSLGTGDVVGPASATDNGVPTFDGTTGKLIKNNSGVTIASGVVTATGFSGPLNGSVGATTPSTVVATQVNVTAQGPVRFEDTSGGQYVGLRAPGTVSVSYTLTLPTADGTSGQALVTDGAGNLSFAAAGITTGKSIAMAMIFGF